MEQTVKRKIGVRDIMTIAAMMVINFAIAKMCIRDSPYGIESQYP